MKRILVSSFPLTLTFLIGLYAQSLFVQRHARIKVSPPGPPIAFQPSSKITKRCSAPYYGMGDGDGVYDPHCFELQNKLADAARVGDVATMSELLRNGASADARAGESYGPLHAAASNGYTEAVRLLLDNGARIDRRDNLEGTALEVAAYEGHIDTVSFLLSRGSDVRMASDVHTLLKIAKRQNNRELVELLEEAGARE